MKLERTKAIEDMFKNYVNKIGLSEETLGKENIFQYNDTKLRTNSKEIIRDVLWNKSFINVLFESKEKYFTFIFEPSSTRLKTIMKKEGTKTIKDIIREYGNKVDVSEEKIGKEILFLYTNKILDAK